jgi:acyl dehydratase
MAPPTTIDLERIKSLSWTTTTSYAVSNIISYNLALGCSGKDLPLVFEGHPDFHALPTFGAVHGIAIMGHVHNAMADFLPNFKGHNHVHGEHFLAMKKAYPIPKGTEEVKLQTTARVVDVVDRRSGVLVCVNILTVEENTGMVVCENEWSGFVMKVPTEGANKQQIQRGARTMLPPVPSRTPDRVSFHQTSPEQGALYRAASNDLNPLHIDPETAKSAGFPAPILTGTCTLGMAARQVIEAFAEGDVSKFGSIKCRLSKPVFAALGEKIRTEMWKDGQSVLFRMVATSGAEEIQREAKEKIVLSGIVNLKLDDAKL